MTSTKHKPFPSNVDMIIGFFVVVVALTAWSPKLALLAVCVGVGTLFGFLLWRLEGLGFEPTQCERNANTALNSAWKTHIVRTLLKINIGIISTIGCGFVVFVWIGDVENINTWMNNQPSNLVAILLSATWLLAGGCTPHLIQKTLPLWTKKIQQLAKQNINCQEIERLMALFLLERQRSDPDSFLMIDLLSGTTTHDNNMSILALAPLPHAVLNSTEEQCLETIHKILKTHNGDNLLSHLCSDTSPFLSSTPDHKSKVRLRCMQITLKSLTAHQKISLKKHLTTDVHCTSCDKATHALKNISTASSSDKDASSGEPLERKTNAIQTPDANTVPESTNLCHQTALTTR